MYAPGHTLGLLITNKHFIFEKFKTDLLLIVLSFPYSNFNPNKPVIWTSLLPLNALDSFPFLDLAWTTRSITPSCLVPIPWGTLTPSSIPTYKSASVLLYPGFPTILERDPTSTKTRNTANELFPFKLSFAFSNAWQYISVSLRICFCHCFEQMFQIISFSAIP